MAINIGSKNYLLKVYPADYSGELESAIADARIIKYTKNLNAGLGYLVFKVERTIEKWNDVDDIELNKVIELWVNDIDTSDYIRVFSGYISRISFSQTHNKRSMEVTVLGFVSRLSKDVLKNGTQTTLYSHATSGVSTTSPAASADPSDMFKAIIDRLRNSSDGNMSFLNYGSALNSTVTDTNLSVQALFEQVTYLEGLEQCRKLCPPNWFWYLDADNTFNLSRKPSVATHSFSFGRIEKINIDYSLEEVVNGVLVFDVDSTYRYLDDDSSIASYGRRVDKIVDSSLEDSSAMDKAARNKIGEMKDPRAIIQVVVSDNNETEKNDTGLTAGYDIESIEVGDTARLNGIPENASAFLSDNMIVTRVSVQPTRAIVDLEVKSTNINEFLVDMKNKLEKNEKSGIPASYTEV